MKVNGSIVVMTFNSHPRSPGSIPFLILLRQNWTVQMMGGESRGYVQVTSADSSRTREIERMGIVELVLSP